MYGSIWNGGSNDLIHPRYRNRPCAGEYDSSRHKVFKFDKAMEHLTMAKQAYQAGNTTGALDQSHTAMAYLQMIDIPGNCIMNNNQM